MSKLSNQCFRCHTPLAELDVLAAARLESTFRKTFPNTWDQEPSIGKRVRVCDPCYEAMSAEQSPEDWERDQIVGGDV